jgi:hypothetical protein
VRKRNIIGQPALARIREESVALKRLAEIEEALGRSPQEGGFHFSDRERQFVKNIRRRFNEKLELTAEQRDRIKRLWGLVRKGTLKDEAPNR